MEEAIPKHQCLQAGNGFQSAQQVMPLQNLMKKNAVEEAAQGKAEQASRPPQLPVPPEITSRCFGHGRVLRH